MQNKKDTTILLDTEPKITKDTKMVKNFIDGKWINSSSNDFVNILNPATEEILARCPLSNSKDVEQAIASAKDAFKSWRKTPVVERIQFLFKLKALLEKNANELAEICTKENGKTLIESHGDLRRGIQMIESASSMPVMLMGKSLEDVAHNIDCNAIKRPLGVFAGITPFNFPPMVPLWFWPFAIACGNTFILKPSERVPLTSCRITELLYEAGLPKGVLNLVNGSKEVVDTLCTHPDIAGVSFVGSTPVAKHVYQTATSKGKRVQALGGAKNFMVVLEDADIEHTIKTIFESCTGCAGQRCLAGSVILCVGNSIYKALEEGLTKKAKEAKVGNGLDSDTEIGPVISLESKNKIISLIQSAIDEGAKILYDGRKETTQKNGFFLRPTVISEVKKNMRIAKEEVFGPVICLANVKTFDEAIEWLNSSVYANTTSLFTKSGQAARKFSYEADPSMIGINIGVPAPMSFFSFGGVKASFFGDIKAHGQAIVDFYTDTKVTITRW